jgi:hypothetical protein
MPAISGEQRQAFDAGLGDQQAVEGVRAAGSRFANQELGLDLVLTHAVKPLRDSDFPRPDTSKSDSPTKAADPGVARWPTGATTPSLSHPVTAD